MMKKMSATTTGCAASCLRIPCGQRQGRRRLSSGGGGSGRPWQQPCSCSFGCTLGSSTVLVSEALQARGANGGPRSALKNNGDHARVAGLQSQAEGTCQKPGFFFFPRPAL